MAGGRGPAGDDGTAGDVQEEARIVRKAYWGLVPLLTVLCTFTYIDRASLGFAALTLKPELGLSGTAYGLGAGIFFLGYAAAMVPSQFALVHIGAATWLAVLTTCWGGVMTCTAAIHNVSGFYAARLFLGLVEGGCFPGCWYHLTTFLQPLEVCFAYSWVASATSVSQVIGAPIAAALLLMDGVGGLHGWQWVFMLEGLATMLYGALVVKFALAPTPARAGFLQPNERKWLAARQQRDEDCAKGGAAAAAPSKFLASFLSWRIYYLCILWFCVWTVVAGVLFYTPLILDAILVGSFDGRAPTPTAAGTHAKAWHSAKIALISIAIFFPASLATWTVSWSAKRFDERNWHSTVPLVISGVMFLVLPAATTHGFVPGLIVLILTATGVFAVFGPIASWPADFLVSRSRASGYAIFNIFSGLGGFVGPYMIGGVTDRTGGSYAWPMRILGILALVAAALAMAFRPHRLPINVESKTGSVQKQQTDVANV